VTPRLILRPSKAGDGVALHKVIMDGFDDQVRWLARPDETPTLQNFEKEARQHAIDWLSRDFKRFVIVSKEDDSIIGRMGYPPMLSDWRVPYFGISYFVARSLNGKGYCSEAVNAMVRYAFVVLSARKVEIKCDTDNVASVRIPEKLGFALEATQKGNWPRTDKYDLAEIRTYSIFVVSQLPDLEVQW